MTTASNDPKATAKKYLENLFNILEEMLSEVENKNLNSGQQGSGSANCCDLSKVRGNLNELKKDFTQHPCDSTFVGEVAEKLISYQNKVKQSFSNSFIPYTYSGMQDDIKDALNNP